MGVGLSNRGGPGTVTVQGSVVGGSSASVLNTSRYEVRVGSSQLLGAIDNTAGGVFRCAAVYDESFSTLDEGCSAEGACVDGDGDGAFTTGPGCGTAPFDCDDKNPAVSPYAPEVCNGLDDDCDGQVDEGCPTTAVLSISPASHDFGDVQVITGSAIRTFVVTNVGAGVSGAPLPTASGDPAFSVASQCGAELGPGASCSADVSFTPQSLGPSSGVLSVAASPGGQVQASLSGAGVCVPDGQEDLPDPSFLDTDCDGIDGSITRAVFVDAASGDDAASGTMSQPKRTIGAAIAIAGLRDVYVSTGVYPETVAMVPGVSLFGGYDAAAGWTRSSSSTTTIQSPTSTAVLASNLLAPTEIQLFRIVSADASGGSPETGAESSYGVRAVQSSDLTLRLCEIVAGDGGSGSVGAVGTVGPQGEPGQSAVGPGFGSGGTSSCTEGAGRTGGRGGDGGTGTVDGDPGQQGFGTGGASGGDGGLAGSCSGLSSTNGSDAPTISGTGSPGGPGAHGTSSSPIGSVSSGSYHPPAGSGGFAGQGGAGGGGGGGGGGTASGADLFCLDCTPLAAGGGGGGGSGGCGGGGGEGGGGGGGSFAVFSDSSSVRIVDTTLATGAGGTGGPGGNGGIGGPGGLPGNGASGANRNSCTTRSAGDGADGTAGGPGGVGGGGRGGAGGPSICVVYSGGAPTITSSPCTPGTGGTGGPGGSNGESAAAAGPAGIVADSRSFP